MVSIVQIKSRVATRMSLTMASTCGNATRRQLKGFHLKFISKFYRTHFPDRKEEFNYSSFTLNLLKLGNNLLP